MKIRFLGQNCFLFNYNNKLILSDPFYNFQKDKSGFDINAQKVDYVLITHAHEDHITDVEEVLQVHPDATIIGQPEVCGYFNHVKQVDLNIGGSYQIGDLKIAMVSATHTSSFPDGRYGGVPAGYVFQFPNKNLYLAGDTGLNKDMEYLTPIFGEITTAILPIGGHYTLDANLASFAAKKLIKTQKVIACHFDTFPPIAINHQEAKEVFAANDIELILPKVGEEIQF
ncbi:metal-dependent hydrolase [Otariodibacter oris]|uniref:L-ascorbate metabolism protein UlaG (Beta-lactamase superfamily) n=1 Tax=Otariodibacter oris TaxID=1032623 RepID=A0A420XG97_9PAST|nr:metal-dependent hydrolase [Otariodibacter oris]QGM80323.1 MBL fold metallo-hydrolase [Otariodibacter oris]RKR71691.1 L-ascorbate metabolism protein UlaG (beta-lactamase superfamily) [Otariodibacter oris]